jgi:hypothetical protein
MGHDGSVKVPARSPLALSLALASTAIGCAEPQQPTPAETGRTREDGIAAGLEQTEPLCDGSDEIRWATAEGLGGRVYVPPFMLDYGALHISIDGQCNFSLYDDSLRGLRRGVISANRATALARDLHFGSYARLAEYEPPVCSDSPGAWVADGTATLRVDCISTGAPPDLVSLASRIQPLTRELDAIAERVWRPVQIQILSLPMPELTVLPSQPIYDWNAPLDLAARALNYADYVDTDLPAEGIPVEDDATLAHLDELRARDIAADDAVQATGGYRFVERGLFVRDAEGRIFQVLVRDEPSEAVRRGWDVLINY